MSGTINLLIGSTVIAMALNFGVQTVLPTPAAITVHSLTYENGEIIQDRTINAKGDVFRMAWSAEIVDANTGLYVPGCTGSGWHNYKTGRFAAKLDLQTWVGSADCTLGPGSYYPRAVWSWGDKQAAATGSVFEVNQ